MLRGARPTTGRALDAGIPVAGSGDHPCGPFEPVAAISGWVERSGGQG